MKSRWQKSLERLMEADNGSQAGGQGGTKTDAASQTSGEDGKSTNNDAGTGANNNGSSGGKGQEATQASHNKTEDADKARGGSGTRSDGSEGSGGRVSFTADQQSEVDRIVEERLNKDRARRAEETKRRAAEESGQFKQLYEEEQRKRADLETKLAQTERGALVARVAGKYGLPEKMHDRIKGQTEAELEADAKELAALLKPKAPDTEAGKRSGAPGQAGAGNKAGAGANGAGAGAGQNGSQNQNRGGGSQSSTYAFQSPNEVAWPEG